MNQNEQKVDWVNLPPDANSVSLWSCLHDGGLLAIHSDLLERTVLLEIDVPHIREHHQLGDDLRFVIQLHDVTSARVNTWAVWPGTMAEHRHKPMEEQNRLVADYQAKWREESANWNDFMAAFATNTFDIYDAEIVHNESSVAVQIHGSLDGNDFDDQFFNFFIRAKQISIQQNDGAKITIENLIQLGESYWDAFGTTE